MALAEPEDEPKRPSSVGGRQKKVAPPILKALSSHKRPIEEFSTDELMAELESRAISCALSIHMKGDGNKDYWHTVVRSGDRSMTHHMDGMIKLFQQNRKPDCGEPGTV